MSVTCSRPSMPPRSINAPYSVRFLTTPVTTAPSARCSSVAVLRTLISSSTAILRETTTLPRRRLSLMILTGISWPDQRIQVVNRARIGLRSRHEGLDSHVHRQPALDAAQHAAGDDELFLVGLFQVVPDAQPRGARVGKQHVAFGRLAVLDHHVDHVARLDRHFARWESETARWERCLRTCSRNR